MEDFEIGEKIILRYSHHDQIIFHSNRC